MKGHWIYIIVLCCLNFASSGVIVLMVQSMHAIIDQHQSAFFGFNTLFVCIPIFATIVMSRISIVYRFAENIACSIRDRLLEVIAFVPIMYFEKKSVSEILSVAMIDISNVQEMIGGSFSVFLRTSVMLVISLIAMLINNARLLFAFLIVIACVLGFLRILNKRVKKFSSNYDNLSARISSQIKDIVLGARTIKEFTSERFFYNRARDTCEDLRDQGVIRALMRGCFVFIVMICVLSFICGVLYLAMHGAEYFGMTKGSVLASVAYLLIAGNSIQNLADIFGSMQSTASALNRIDEVMQADTENEEFMHKKSNDKYDIEFKDVVFHYNSRPEIAVLNHFSLKIKQGEKIAIIGRSGIGKSTIMSLMMGFYDISHGEILLGGENIAHLSRRSLRNCVSVVAQEPFMFRGSIRDNILMGYDATMDELWRALEIAYAVDFVNKIPMGIDAIIGDIGLSVGQKQRISIARAVIRKPKILFLDEYTSALDTETSNLVHNSIMKSIRGATMISITHKKENIQDFDHVIDLG